MNTDLRLQRRDRRAFLLAAGAAAAGWTMRPTYGWPASPSPGELTGLTLAEASRLVRGRKVSAVALVEACLERIQRLDRQLNAFITVTSDLALSQARRADEEIARGAWRGPLHGVPIALKDNIDTAGVRTTGASAVFADRIPPEDSEVAQRLKAGGAVLLGKLNMHEFANGGDSVVSYWGPVHNPWALDREAGGSSGGSAAAVAAELCYGALGTDTGGSIRVPAAHCGIVGLKPTYGRVSNRGVIPLCWSYDHVGPMCRTVEDAALLLQVIAGYDPADLSSANVPGSDCAAALAASTRNLRVGIPRAFFYDVLETDVRSAVEEAISVIRPGVASIRDVTLPQVLDLADAGDAEFYAFHKDTFERAAGLYQPSTQRNLKLAASQPGAAYVRARRALEERRRDVVRVFQDVDLLIAPTVKYTAKTIKYWQDWHEKEAEKVLPPIIWNTWLFNIFGLPAMSVPCGFTSGGLPIGLMIAGAPFGEDRVLALGHAYQKETAWHRQKPTLRPNVPETEATPPSPK